MAFFEFVQDVSPGASGFNVREGKLTRVWQLKPNSAAEITDAIRRVLGGTQYAPTADGRLKRDLPLRDPQFGWLHASNISQIVGMGMRRPAADGVGAGLFGEMNVADPSPAELISPTFGLYPHYHFTVESTPRPFVVAPDNRIEVLPAVWANFNNVPLVYNYATEFNRYVDAVSTVTPQALQGQQGTMVFQSQRTPPHGSPFAGRPMMYLPNEGLAVTWYQVPHRYISSQNSYIAGAQGNRPWFGCVNFDAISFCGVRYPRGSLLYLGYSLSARYPRAVDVRAQAPNLVAGDPLFGAEKYVDVTFNFGVTWRTAPAGTLYGGANPNNNFVRAGWNLLPNMVDRRYHFASSRPVGAAEVYTPAFYSAPFFLLFMDPDVAQGNIISND